MKQTVIEWFNNIFRLKSLCCKKPMKYIDIHYYWGGGESIVYQCVKCKKQWT